ncbi:MAG: nucleoside deaminase [Anaerolineaceae bacterium]|nr:nucleoside deaminase [Anaerolineaceae bacterium]
MSGQLLLKDEEFLREAISHADQAGRKGNRPFGAVLVRDNKIIARAESSQHADHDITYHAELKLVSQASRFLERADFGGCTLYSSSEPCPMCSGAIYWSGISRVVFGCRQKLLGELESEKFAVPCSDILTRGGRQIEIVGPLLEEESFEILKCYLEER